MISRCYRMLYEVEQPKRFLWTYRGIKVFLNLLYPLYMRIKPINTQVPVEENVIISLTTFPARIQGVHKTVDSLLRQKRRAKEVHLYLAKTQFSSLEALPKSLLRLQEKGLKIKLCEDLRSHKKYYEAMKNHPEMIVITADDDSFYPEDFVEKLVETSKANPGTICCNLAHEIKTRNGEILPYNQWNQGAQGITKASHKLFPVGCQGVLYPPGLLHPDLFDTEKIRRLAFMADDLWLKAMATKNEVKAVKVHGKSIAYVNFLTTEKSSLNRSNVLENQNDVQLKNILKEYPSLKEYWIF